MTARSFAPIVARRIAPPAVSGAKPAARLSRAGGAPAGLPRFAAGVRSVGDGRSHGRWENEAGALAEAVRASPPPARRAVMMREGAQDQRGMAPRPVLKVTPSPSVAIGSSIGSPLPGGLRQRLESVTGADLGAVRVHTSPQAQRAAALANARAFASGSHIYLGRGEAPGDSNLLAHETAHTIQQSATAHAAFPRGPPRGGVHTGTLTPAPQGMIQRFAFHDFDSDPHFFWPALLSGRLRSALFLVNDAGFFTSMLRLVNEGVSTVLGQFPLKPQHFSWVLDWFRSSIPVNTDALNADSALFGGSMDDPISDGLRALSRLLRGLLNGNWRWLSEALSATRQTFAWFRGRLQPGFQSLGILTGLPELAAAIEVIPAELRANASFLDDNSDILGVAGEMISCDRAARTANELASWVETQQRRFLEAPDKLRQVAWDIEQSLGFIEPMQTLSELGRGTADLRSLLDEAAGALDDPDNVPDDARLFQVVLPRLRSQTVLLGDAISEAAMWPSLFIVSFLSGARAWVATLQSGSCNVLNWIEEIARELNSWMESVFDSAFETAAGIFMRSPWLSVLDQLFTAIAPAVADEETPEIKPSLLIRALRKLGVPEELLQKIQQSVHALGRVVRHPFRFFKNLAAAIVGGLHKFVSNLGKHLMDAIVAWLFGELSVTAPNPFTLPNALRSLASLIGLTLDHLLEVLDKKHPGAGRKVRKALEAGTIAVRWVRLLWERNYEQLWQELKAYLYNFWSQLIIKAQEFIIDFLVSKGIDLLVSFLTPGLRQAVKIVKDLYRAIKQMKAQAERMLGVVNSVCNFLGDIVDGKIEGAIDMVDRLAQRLLRFAVRFFADWLGLGDIPKKIREAVDTVRELVDKVLEKLIDLAAKVWEWLAEKAAEIVEWWKNRSVFQNAAGEIHTLDFDKSSEEIHIETTRKPLKEYLDNYKDPSDDEKAIIAQIRGRATKINGILAAARKKNNFSQTDGEGVRDHFTAIAKLLARLGADEAVPPTKVTWKSVRETTGRNWDDGAYMQAEFLSVDPGGNVGSEPFEESDLWKKVRRRKDTYVRGHLLNHNVHGPGAKKNLIPITIQTNNEMKTSCETKLKKAIIDEKRVIRYEVWAEFGQSKRANIPEESDLPLYMWMKAVVLQKKDKSWEPAPGSPLIQAKIPHLRFPDDTKP